MKNKLFLGAIGMVASATTLQGVAKKDNLEKVNAQHCACKTVHHNVKKVKSDKLEDNLIQVSDVSFELHKNSRASIKKMLDKYGENAKFSFPIKMSQVDYHYKGDTKSTFDAIVYITPKMAKKILSDKEVNKVILNGVQKKHKNKSTFVVKDIKPVFMANLEPGEEEWLITERKNKAPKETLISWKRKDTKKVNYKSTTPKPKSQGVMKNKDEIDIENVFKKAAKKWS